MKRATLAVSLCLSIPATQALAVDWSVNSSLSETVELNSNQFLRSMLAGGTLGSYSTLTTNAQALTPTSRFIFDGDITYQKYWGPGTEAIPQTEFRQDGVKARYETIGKNAGDLTFGEVIFRESSTALAILSNLGIATAAQGFIDASTVRAGIERNVTSLDFLTISGRSTYTNYDPPGGGTPFTDSSALGTWRHRLNSNLALTASSEFEWLSFNNLSNTNILILRDMAGVDTTISPLLSFRGTAGVAYVKSDQSGASAIAPVALPTTNASSGSVADLITDMVLTYRMMNNVTLTLFGNQTIGPSVVGSITKQTTIGTSLTEVVNSRSSISFALSASRQITGSSVDFYSGSITYSYQLAREWSSQISYRHLHRTATTSSAAAGIFDPITGVPIISSAGPADSDSIMLVVTRNFNLLPRGN